MKRFFFLIFFLSCQANATESLWAAYQDAAKNDPIFQQQKAILQQAEQQIPISRSYLLPQLILSAQGAYTYQSSVVAGVSDFNSNQYTVNFSQAIFNLSAFNQLRQSKISVQAAAMLFSSQAQELMVRFIRAYLNVLQTKDLLTATTQQETFAAQFLKKISRKYELKFATITEMDQARQQYELLHSQAINAKIAYEQSLQNLSNITSVVYPSIASFSKKFHVAKITPSNVAQWINIAKKQNLALLASQLNLRAAEEQMSIKKTDFLPTVSAITNYSNTNELSTNAAGGTPETVQDTLVGISASWNLSQGGLTIGQLRQARAAYMQSSATVSQRYLEAITNARNAYLGIMQGADSVAASRAAVTEGAQGLIHTSKGFKAGVQTIFDLLQAQNRYFDAQRQDIQNFYQYILNTILLKQAAGTLSPHDLHLLSQYTKNTKGRS